MKRILLTGFVLAFFIHAGAQTQISVCPQVASFSSMTRGYYFTAPCNFTICGLYVPTDMSTANQSVAVVRFTAGPPPAYASTTNSFVQLFYQPNYPVNAMIPCNITVNAGEIIGVYGSRGAAVNSYGAANCPTTILGNPVTLYRSGMQYDLATTPMQEIWYEDYNIGRVFMYINCCPTADFTVTTPVCLGQPVTATYTGSGTPPAATFSWTFTGGVPASAATVGPHSITYATPGTKTISLSVSQSGCTTVNSTQNVVVNDNPTVTVTPGSSQVCSGNSATFTAGGASSYNWSGGLGTNASQTVSPGSTTTYTVTGTDGNGCSGTASTTITVNPNPTITISPSSAQICAGNSVTLTASGGNTYSWSGGLGTNAVQTVSPGTTTTYTVTGTNTSGCTGSASVTVTVNPNPTIAISPATTQICAGNSVMLTASGGNTYNWSGGLGTNATQTVSPGTTTTYTVTGTDVQGCSATASATVTVNPNPTVTISPSSPQVCPGSSVTITASGANSYNWSGGLGSNASQTVSPTATTTYTVTGTSTAGCTGTASVTVTMSPNLSVGVTPAAPSICSGNSVLLTGTGANTYSWSGGLGAGTTQTVSPAATTTYTVTGTDSFGCTGTASVTVTVNSNPVVTVNPATAQVCEGEPITLTAGGASTYSWSGGLGTNSSQTVTPASTTTFTVTGTDNNGCTGSASVTITVNSNPVISAAANPPTVCVGGSTTLTASGGTSYIWDSGNTNASYSVSPVVSTTYLVTGTDGNGCSGTAQVFVDVYSGITVSINPANPSVCEGDDIQLEALPNNAGFTYNWSSGQTSAVITVMPATTTDYSVFVTDNQGCTGTAQTTVTVNSLPVVDFSGTPVSGCKPVTVIFNNSGSIGTYEWDFGDGTTSASSSPSHQYSQSGTYDVTLFVTDANGCSGQLTLTDYIEVYPIPDAGFIPSADVVYLGESSILFTDVSVGASSWYWDFGNNEGYSNDQNPEYTYLYEGTYTVWQYVENQWGCRDSISENILVKPVVSFYIPNAFSPNGDGQNDYFVPFGNNINPEEYQMLIYDRWGKQIFRADNLNTPWDGTSFDSAGEVLPQGVYSYSIKVKLDGNVQIFRGIVALIW